MGLTLSALRIRFNNHRLVARNLITPLSEIVFLKEAFCVLSGTTLSKVKGLYSEVFNWGRLMVFLNFAEQLELTEEEWEHLFNVLVPTLTQISE